MCLDRGCVEDEGEWIRRLGLGLFCINNPEIQFRQTFELSYGYININFCL